METWWNSFDIVQKLLLCIAGTATLIFIVQAVLTFLGMDADGGLDADLEGIESSFPFQLFTFRNMINFLLGFSWSGLVFYHAVERLIWFALITIGFGCAFVAVVMLIFRLLSKTVESGNISIEDTIGLNANVYLLISGYRERAGKVQLSVKGSIREYDAVTDGETLKTGELVVVEKVLEGNILLVKKLS